MLKKITRRFFLGMALVIFFAMWDSSPLTGQSLRSGQPAPEISAGPWINSEPLTLGGLKGRVVLVEFWTYG